MKRNLTQHQADGAVAPRVSGRELAKVGFLQRKVSGTIRLAAYAKR